MSIIIIDDSIPFKIALKAMLEEAGYSGIQLFDNIGGAIQYFQSEKCTDIKLILLDIQMPEINGIEAAKIIKANDYTKDIQIIMVTAQDEEENIEKAFEAGAIDYISKPIKKYELRARIKSVLNLVEEREKRIEKELELQEANRKLQQIAITDGLTQIYNRRYFNENLEKVWRSSIRKKNYVSLIMCDIDYFKKYNDYYGHQGGDNVLKKVAKTIKNSINRPMDFAARYGGEEFVILLPDTISNGALQIANTILHSIRELELEHKKSEVSDIITISIGVSTMRAVLEKGYVTLLKEADEALYTAKEFGRNRICQNEN